jgi:hypothetical protein
VRPVREHDILYAVEQAGIEQVMQVLRQAGRQNRGQAGRTGGWDRQIEIWSKAGQALWAGRTYRQPANTDL